MLIDEAMVTSSMLIDEAMATNSMLIDEAMAASGHRRKQNNKKR